jgi:hypothetical protein
LPSTISHISAKHIIHSRKAKPSPLETFGSWVKAEFRAARDVSAATGELGDPVVDCGLVLVMAITSGRSW